MPNMDHCCKMLKDPVSSANDMTGKVSVRPAEELFFASSSKTIGPKNYAGKSRVRNTTGGPDRATAALGATGAGTSRKVPYLFQVN